MILEELVLHNYGLFKGRHSLSLCSTRQTKPVVLIGGLNGGGKTTVLDAIQLALYGKRARCSNRGSLSYEEYLMRCINSSVGGGEGAAVELQFRQRSEGVEHTYRIHRSWIRRGGTVRERVEVLKDGAYNRNLTDGWNEVVEEFIPASMSHLFFFDGEKIEAFADLENSRQLLSKAISSLLGIDHVERLSTDLVVLAGRQRSKVNTLKDRHLIEKIEVDATRLESMLADYAQRRASEQNKLDRIEGRLNEAKIRYSNEGGHLFDERENIEADRRSTALRLAEVVGHLTEIAVGAGPLLLVKDLILSVAGRAELEDGIQRARAISSVLEERDAKMLDALTRHRVPKKFIGALEEFITSDREVRAVATHVEPYLKLNYEGLSELRRLAHGDVLRNTEEELLCLLQSARDLQSQLDDADRRLAGVPVVESLTAVLDELKSLEASLQQQKVRLDVMDSEISRITRERDQKKSEWLREAEKVIEAGLEHEDEMRIVTHASRVRKTLEKFKQSVVRHHVKRIEGLILDSFKQLLRKSSLISELRIDPERFSLELRDASGNVILPDRLSAGERQLLAVSMLWGLARASGRPLPAVIDTPLGRLDTHHRLNLIERYFPNASHQVLLLSTDEEIDEKLYQKLKPWIGRSYTLDFDDSRGSTDVRPGYFWQGA
jgi:DNA sulfur modification protein DndD